MIASRSANDILAEITNEIVRSYDELEIIQHLDGNALPVSQAVIEIALDLTDLLFPGYRRHRNLGWTAVDSEVGGAVARLYEHLKDQIAGTLRNERRSDSVSPDSRAGVKPRDVEAELQAREKTIAFLHSLPRIRRLIATDVQAAFDGDPAARNTDEIILCYPGLEAIAVYRLAHELHGLAVPLIPRMMTEWAHSRTGIDIHPGAKIGPGFFIDHGTGVVIGETCEIADHVKLYQGVTLGALSFPKDAQGNLIRGTKRHPTLERKVVVYANATILGGRTVVGANSVIGAGVSVTKSVPPNTVVTVEKPSLRFHEVA